MDRQQLIHELEAIINKGFEDYPFPYVKGNSIRIGKIVIRSSRHGYLVYDTECNKQVVQTFSKSSAIAIAKNLAQNKNITDRVMDIDKTLEKNYNDALYYQNSYNKTKDELKKDVLETRLDIAHSKTEHARSLLDNYIYS